MDLDQLFQQHLNLRIDTGPGTRPRAELSTGQLRALKDQAEQHAGKSPAPFLAEEQRAAFAQKRSPQLGEILHQCGVGLEAAADFAATLPVTRAVCDNIMQVDDATTQLIKVTGDVYDAANAGVLQCAAEAAELGEKVLQAVAERAETNYPLVLQFASALSLYQAAAQRRQAQRSKAEAAVAPAQADADAAGRQAEEALALADFHRKNNR